MSPVVDQYGFNRPGIGSMPVKNKGSIMKIVTSVWTGMALLAMVQAAQAAAPLVSGKYALMDFTQCQAGFTTTTDNYVLGAGGTAPAVKSVNPAGNGELSMGVGSLTFPATAASSGPVSFELNNVSGSSLRIGGSGAAIAVHPETGTGTYSFTDTTLTITPTVGLAMTWTMRPGNIVSGVARTLYMVRRESAKCVNAVTATKQ